MSTRFEVLKNGRRLSVSGINGQGVLSVNLTYVKGNDGEDGHDLIISGLVSIEGATDQTQHVTWNSADVSAGDEITIRILPPGEFDEPQEAHDYPRETRDDPDLGEIRYYIDAWEATIPFDCAPIESAFLHLCSDESGPTPTQRELILQLCERHQKLWPEICRALVGCHPHIKSAKELAKRVAKQLSVNMYDDSDAIELVYCVEGDPEFVSYFVTLQDWKIVEACRAE